MDNFNITPLTETDARGLLSPPLPDETEAIFADLVVAGPMALPEEDVSSIKSMIIDYYDEIGYRVRMSNITWLGITDEGHRLSWVIVYLDWVSA